MSEAVSGWLGKIGEVGRNSGVYGELARRYESIVKW